MNKNSKSVTDVLNHLCYRCIDPTPSGPNVNLQSSMRQAIIADSPGVILSVSFSVPRRTVSGDSSPI